MRRVLLIVVGALCMWSGTAGAAQIVQPATQPFTVPSDAHGNPVAFTVVASGFTPGVAVYVEQCDGKPPTTAQWQPTANCDLASSPAAAFADASGNATFDAHDPNKKFVPFVGESPQQLFSCPAPGSCTVRVSTNNSSATNDQVFFAIKLPAPQGPPVTQPSGTHTTSPAANAAGMADPSSNATPAAAATAGANTAAATPSTGPYSLAFTGITAVLAGIGLVVLGLGVALLSRHAGRRASTS